MSKSDIQKYALIFFAGFSFGVGVAGYFFVTVIFCFLVAAGWYYINYMKDVKDEVE